MNMDIVTSVTALRDRLQREPDNVFVPTMGNLHEGHIDLIRIAKPKAACTVVSIFVNRLQFGPKEDFERYPRTFQSDCDKLRSAGVNVVLRRTKRKSTRSRRPSSSNPPTCSTSSTAPSARGTSAASPRWC